jgi:hypothetical protein
MGCGCKKRANELPVQEQAQNVTIKLTESNTGSSTTITQTQEELVEKIVAKLNDLEDNNQ